MKILLYGINYSPELTGIGKYTGELAEWLIARGHQVRVVTAPPYYPDWSINPEFGNGWSVLKKGSYVIYRCPLWVPRKPSGVKRLLHLLSFAVLSFPVVLWQVFWRPQLVWVVEPALFCAPAAVTTARLCGAKAWLHVQDFEVDAAFTMGLLRGVWLQRIVEGAERWLKRRFDIISTISQRMYQRLLDKGIPPAKAVLAVNWVDVVQFGKSSPEAIAAYRYELDIPDGAVIALYSGNMGGKQGLELLADVAACCQQEFAVNSSADSAEKNQIDHAQVPIVFVFCGNGSGRADLLVRCQGLSNVRFLDLQPAERLSDLLATADIHLLPQRADAADLVMPSKLTGMLASARPVVVTAHEGTELASVVNCCGLVVEPENATAMAHAVKLLAADPVLRKHLGQVGHTYALTHMDREAVLSKFETDILARSK
nr:glycosyltransferase WbuB [uncultured Rhodoferax sp.]